MSNLNKVFSVWQDLEKSYKLMGKGETRSDFLRKLVANGNSNSVQSTLAKISLDISDEVDTTNYTTLQKIMLTVLSNFSAISDDIVNLNQFIRSLLSQVKVSKSFDDLLSSVAIYQPLAVARVQFHDSTYGLDVVNSDTVHIVKSESTDALTVKSLSQVKLLKEYSGDDPFCIAARNYILGRKSISNLSLIFMKNDYFESEIKGTSHKSLSVDRDGSYSIWYNAVTAKLVIV